VIGYWLVIAIAVIAIIAVIVSVRE